MASPVSVSTFRFYLGTLLLFLFFPAAPLAAQSDEGRERPLATVDSAVITVGDFERSYIAFLISTGSDDTAAHRYKHLNTLIDQHLLAAEARLLGLDASDDYAMVIKRARLKAIGTRFFEQTALDALPPPTDAEVRQAFSRSQQKVAVRHLFYRNEAEVEAAYKRLQDGQDFLVEAESAYNLAAFDSSAGYLGLIGYFDVDDVFAETAFALDVGAFSEPIRSRQGYHILRVEDKVINPILTEAAYQTKKSGIASRVRQRRRRLIGDQFVQSFMAERAVHIQPQGIEALSLAISNLVQDADPQPVAMAVTESGDGGHIDPQALGAVLTPATSLATYSFGGETITFTAGDYYFWLPELPFEEAQHRTAASVGRALRNELLARAGQSTGLATDTLVQRETEEHARVYLSAALLADVRRHPPPSIDPDFLREAYERLRITPPSAPDSEQEAQLVEQLAPLYAEFLLLKRLRDEGAVVVNDSSVLR